MSKHTDLLREVQNIYKGIKAYEQRLETIREEICTHPVNEITNYQWAPGHIVRGKVCNICGKFTGPCENAKLYTARNGVFLNEEYSLDLGSSSPVLVKVLKFLPDNKVFVEYLNSSPGRTETLSADLFPTYK